MADKQQSYQPYPSEQPPPYTIQNTSECAIGPQSPGHNSSQVAGQQPIMIAGQNEVRPPLEVASDKFGSSFSDKSIRRAFVRKVYLILLCQVLVTFGITAVFVFVDCVGEFVRENVAMYYASYGIFVVVYIALVCCPTVRRRYPANIICLAIFTLALSYMTGTISSFYDSQAVFISAGICAGVCLGISLLSFWSKFDITGWGPFLCIFSLVLFFFGFACIFTYNDVLNTVYGALAALLLMMLLGFHTQLILGGRRHELSPEEYIGAALVLYLDIVYIFLIFLGLTGRN